MGARGRRVPGAQPIGALGWVYAAYGDAFVALPLAWGVLVERFRPDRHHVLGALVVVCGVLVIVVFCRPRKGRGGKEKGMKAQARNPKGEPSVACNFAAMDGEQRERYRALRRRLGEDFHEARELEDGYAFRYSSEEGVLVALAEYVSLEQLCCPFFDFAIEVERGGGEVWLRMTGPEGAKGILEAAMGGEARGATVGEPD
jgi:hypothetical protein